MSRIERGGANPSLDAIEVLASALGVEVAQLFCINKTDENGSHPDTTT
jgi:transcriptional regulator with XRE-family HTH domain